MYTKLMASDKAVLKDTPIRPVKRDNKGKPLRIYFSAMPTILIPKQENDITMIR